MIKNQYQSFVNSETILANPQNGFSFFQPSPIYPADLHIKSKMLGKRMEEFFMINIEADEQYKIIEAGLQIIDKGITIGELDFIIQNKLTHQIEHIELAYKFYLYNPLLNEHLINSWVGPNKNDYLHLKLRKLFEKQFPLLYHSKTKELLLEKGVEVEKVEQKLCFLGKLYIPYQYREIENLKGVNKACLDGFWIDKEAFNTHNDFKELTFFIPEKLNWHTPINEQVVWIDFNQLNFLLKQYHQAKKSPMVWVKNDDKMFKLFITWWVNL